MLKTYHGSCYCGVVRFEAISTSLSPLFVAICTRNRFWAAVVKPAAFRLLEGKTELKQYLFSSARPVAFVRAESATTPKPAR